MNSTATIRTTLVVDVGPVAEAAGIIARETTLAEHVTFTADGWTATVEITDGLPFEVWGSGTQALWRLLSAIAYTGETVSLYEVASRLDARNSAAVADALRVLFGGAR